MDSQFVRVATYCDVNLVMLNPLKVICRSHKVDMLRCVGCSHECYTRQFLLSIRICPAAENQDVMIWLLCWRSGGAMPQYDRWHCALASTYFGYLGFWDAYRLPSAARVIGISHSARVLTSPNWDRAEKPNAWHMFLFSIILNQLRPVSLEQECLGESGQVQKLMRQFCFPLVVRKVLVILLFCGVVPMCKLFYCTLCVAELAREQLETGLSIAWSSDPAATCLRANKSPNKWTWNIWSHTE